jgi:pyridoxal phosphate enzyme (YggS family)
MTSIEKNIQQIHNQIHECETHFGREKNSVRLLAVSKGQPIDAINAAYAAGQYAFGENYLQEALAKMAALADKKIEWHFIGPIQRNKTKKIAEHFSWVQTVSDMIIAERLNNQRPLNLPPLNICIQINVSHEESKFGISADQAFFLAAACEQLPRLRLRGLMAIPAEKKFLADQRVEFKKLKLLFEKLCKKGIKLDTLSMGMSNDLTAAIAEGSTMIRIGTKIFGGRQ